MVHSVKIIFVCFKHTKSMVHSVKIIFVCLSMVHSVKIIIVCLSMVQYGTQRKNNYLCV